MRFRSKLMKKFSISISVLNIFFSTMFLVVSTETRAEPQGGAKEDLVSELRLQSAGLLGPKMYSVEGKDLKNDPLQVTFIPLKQGLNVFIDNSPPPYQDGLIPKSARTSYRAVIGLHFSLR